MTGRRAPRIPASLHELRNDLRPPRPFVERLLNALGARPSCVDAVLGDLAEERARHAGVSGDAAALWWYLRELLRSAPHLLADGLRYGGPAAWARTAALLTALAIPPAIVAAVLMRDPPPAELVFQGQRGSDAQNAIVLNTTHPVQLVTRALDAKGRLLPPTTVRYERIGGRPVAVTPSGAVTCNGYGDSELRASAGALWTTLLVRCRPVNAVSGDMVLSLLAGGGETDLPVTARSPSGRREDLIAFDARVRDSSVARVQGLRIRPVAPGTTVALVSVGDATAQIWVNVYEPVSTLQGLRPDQRLVSAPVDLAAGDSIQWPLPTGQFWLRFTPRSKAEPVPRIVVRGAVSCIPAFGPTDQARCLVHAAGAWIRIANPRASRTRVVGRLALERS